jgi:UDP-N-acetylglucosamine diphosphorylase / glucose-1-phosphate thymidylyltransferase / UDP-N-acetylgalactosamine diphosphorylase / glucosamine-1-phosphate N-acetyltransferase / galactosamine-1-phosphate N-acetyltransferase
MYRYIIEDTHFVPPFNEPASELTLQLRQLKIHQEELITSVLGGNVSLAGVFQDARPLESVAGEALVYRDNLWFDRPFFEDFIARSRRSGAACRAAFPADDRAFAAYTVPLATCIQPAVDREGRAIYLLDLWYFPDGYDPAIQPVVIGSDYHEIGFYDVPDFMATGEIAGEPGIRQKDKLVHYAPMRAVASIESWVHVYFVSIIYGNFARAGRLDRQIERSAWTQLRLLWRALLEQRQILQASGAVKIGKNCSIDPSAIITGPTEIGDNVSIGAGVIIDNCTIGSHVTIDAGCALFQSTVNNNCFLPFRAALYLTHVMENTIISQNTCLQMCVIGRNTFVGAGTTFTDFNMIAQKPIRAADRNGRLQDVGQIVLGSGVGHNCRIGSGMVVMPGRMIESDVVLIASPDRRVVSRSIGYEESDHHQVAGGEYHQRLYPRPEEDEEIDDVW